MQPSRRSFLASALPAAAAATAVPKLTPRPAKRPHAFRVSTARFQSAYGRRPKLHEERAWSFDLLTADGSLVSSYSGTIDAFGPFCYVLGLAKRWAWQNGAAIIEVCP
jgi:hypothetical protein